MPMDNQERHGPSSADSPRGEGGRGEGRGGGRGRFVRRTPRVCPFCHGKVAQIDFKQPELLRRYLTERGKIKPRRKIGTCSRHQRRLALAIKRARHIALLSYSDARGRD